MRFRVAYLVGVNLVVLIALVGAGILYTNRAAAQASRETEQKFCEVFGLLVGSGRQAPSQTEAGRVFQARIETLYAKLGCPPIR